VVDLDRFPIYSLASILVSLSPAFFILA